MLAKAMFSCPVLLIQGWAMPAVCQRAKAEMDLVESKVESMSLRCAPGHDMPLGLEMHRLSSAIRADGRR